MASQGQTPAASDYALAAKQEAEVAAPDLPYRPPMPKDRSAPIALVGAGGISGAHLDAYARYGLNVIAICSRDLDRARARRDAFFPAAWTTDDFETLLRDPAIAVLDITTHADVRADLMRRALLAENTFSRRNPSSRTSRSAGSWSNWRGAAASRSRSIRTAAGRRIWLIFGRQSRPASSAASPASMSRSAGAMPGSPERRSRRSRILFSGTSAFTGLIFLSV